MFVAVQENAQLCLNVSIQYFKVSPCGFPVREVVAGVENFQ
jgi:hypothetical protein